MNTIELDFMKGMVSILNEVIESYNNTGEMIITKEQYNARFEDLKQLEEETGVMFANSPTINKDINANTKLRYLVCNQNCDSSNFENIRDLGIEIISEEELVDMLSD